MNKPEPSPPIPAKQRRQRKQTVAEAGPDPIDIHVGARVRMRRIMIGLSQQALGHAIGLNFQQIQKYERGFNRISASTLHRLAEALDVPVSFFFDALSEGPARAADNGLIRREGLELLRHFYRLDVPMRKQVYELVRAMGRDGDGDPSPQEQA
ncbi:MAG: helix-turn-helix domain-containing protein [Rhodospirillaceae bacterium]|nr:helix-turn-helix domain-containing protein [Rhodospirillales bacterium]